jgi:hypothetical protein
MVLVLIVGATLALVILNLANALALGEFWPFLAAQIWLFAIACLSFALLLLRRHGGPAV